MQLEPEKRAAAQADVTEARGRPGGTAMAGVLAGMEYGQQLATLSPDNQAGPVRPDVAPVCRLPGRGDAAEAAFRRHIQAGESEFSAFMKAAHEEPASLGWIFLTEFARSDLEPFIQPFGYGSDVLGLAPDKRLQVLGQALGQGANAMRAFVGWVKGDKQKIREAVVESGVMITIDLASRGLGVKTTDGRISKIYINAKGKISKTGKAVFFNNVALLFAGKAASHGVKESAGAEAEAE